LKDIRHPLIELPEAPKIATKHQQNSNKMEIAEKQKASKTNLRHHQGPDQMDEESRQQAEISKVLTS